MTQASKAYIDDLMDMSDPPDTSNCQSEIVQFYTGKNILVTGSSGLLGLLLTERILRCCPNINKLYLFMREKKTKSAQQRFDEYFDEVIFERLKKEQPNFKRKVTMIEADLSKIDLGLSTENQKYLLKTNIIFHLAANVRFSDTLRNAVNTNVRGTKELILLAKKMPNFQAFIYVSTAFSNCVHNPVEEVHYLPPLNTEKVITLIDTLEDEMLIKITPTLLDKWPNSYVYTKAIAEATVREYSVGIPTGIIRPSIVITTLEEPVAGWINNIYGAVGVTVGSAIGLLHTLHCVPDFPAEIVPADYVIANMLAVAWDVSKKKDNLLSIENIDTNVLDIDRVPIYNYVSSCENPINWDRYMSFAKEYGEKMGSTKCIWCFFLFLNRYKFVHNICVLFLHMLPGIIIDFFAILLGRKPGLLKIYKKINTFNDVISYFSSRKWEFRNDAVVKLWKRMNPADRQLFKFNIGELDWRPCLETMLLGLRIYMLKDPIDTLEEGRKKYNRLVIAHYTLITVLSILFAWIVFRIVNFII